MQSPEVEILMQIVGSIEGRAKQQGKDKYLMHIYKAALDPVIECAKNGPRTPTEEKPMAITLDALYHMHAGMVALLRLTGSDDILEWVRPNIMSHAENPEFRRAFAVDAMQGGAAHIRMTPEKYGVLVDELADQMLRQAGAA